MKTLPGLEPELIASARARGGQGGHEYLGVKGDLPGALIDGDPVPAVVDVHLGSGVVL
ncbi:MAG: hypothetical protein M0Z34_00995 [Nitrospiraceae bacterium]|nr:hypothetical protein [Nitrospiraceae bacterium]